MAMTDDLEVRLRQTFAAVAERTTVATRDPGRLAGGSERVDSQPADPPSTRRLWWIAAAVVLLGALAAGALLLGGDDTTEAPVATQPTTTMTSVPEVSGLDAFLIPPATIAGAPRRQISPGWQMVDGGEAGGRSRVSMGPWTVTYTVPGVSRTLVYQYGPDSPEQAVQPAEWLAIVGPAAMDRGGIDGATDPRWVTGLDGVEFADLGVICAEDDGFPYLSSISGVPAEGCQRRAIGIGPDVVIEIAILPSKDLDAVIRQIQLGTLEELEATGAELLPGSLVPPTMPVQEVEPPPDTPFCNAWTAVLEGSLANGESGALWSPVLAVAMEAAAGAAPTPEIAADIRVLAEDWRDEDPSDESAAVMQRVINAAEAECPGIGAWVTG
jgi:hypothetical protein